MARILVVEDDQNLRDLVVRRLQHAGHRVQGAEDGAAATNLVSAKGAPDVVVLDVNMPDVDGFELLEILRRQTGQVDLRAVFLSGRSELDDIATGRALGAVYLTKPFVGNALIGAIDTQLNVGSEGAALEW
jgi:DNA-binding response OmpR family regulator